MSDIIKEITEKFTNILKVQLYNCKYCYFKDSQPTLIGEEYYCTCEECEHKMRGQFKSNWKHQSCTGECRTCFFTTACCDYPFSKNK